MHEYIMEIGSRPSSKERKRYPTNPFGVATGKLVLGSLENMEVMLRKTVLHFNQRRVEIESTDLNFDHPAALPTVLLAEPPPDSFRRLGESVCIEQTGDEEIITFSARLNWCGVFWKERQMLKGESECAD